MKPIVFLLALLSCSAVFASSDGYVCNGAWPVRYGIVPASFRLAPARVQGSFFIQIDGRDEQNVGVIERIETHRKDTADEAERFGNAFESNEARRVLPGSERADSVRVFSLKLKTGYTATFSQFIAGDRIIGAVLTEGTSPLSCLTR